MRSLLGDIVGEAGELYHYTTFAGLAGIYQTNTIWATHYKFLNDTSEFAVFHGLLLDRVREELERMQPVLATNLTFRQFVNATSGSLSNFAADHAYGVVDAIYDWDIADAADNFTPKAPDDAPYVASFCEHSKDDEFTRANGLLSQWRGYTGRTKYCVVLDAPRMAELLRAEAQTHLWRFATFDRVRYSAPEQSGSETFEAIVNFCIRSVVSGIFGSAAVGPPEKMDGYSILNRLGVRDSVISCAATTKHHCFAEEREFRVVVLRGGPEAISQALELGQSIPNRLPKEIHSRQQNGRSVPYVRLFDKIETPLPISRIIVGPSQFQNENLELARDIVGSAVPITCSSTPFLE